MFASVFVSLLTAAARGGNIRPALAPEQSRRERHLNN